MDRECHFSIMESSNFEIKPTLGVAFILCSLGIASSPNTIMLIAISYHFVHVARVEAAIEEDVRLVGLCESEVCALWDVLVMIM